MKSKYWKKKKMYWVLCNMILDSCTIELPKLQYCSYNFFRGAEWIEGFFDLDDVEYRFKFYKSFTYARLSVWVFNDTVNSFEVYVDLVSFPDQEGSNIVLHYHEPRYLDRALADALGFH